MRDPSASHKSVVTLVLATPWSPDLSPIGCPSVAALLICGLLLLVASPRSNPNALMRMAGLLGSPLLLAITLVVFLVPTTRHTDAADYVAVYALTTFGLLFAAEHLRHAGFVRGIGFVWFHLFGGLLVAETWITSQIADFVRVRVTTGELALLFVGQLPIWTIAARCFRVRTNLKPGTCVSCAYDLTGNVSGRCPECGVAVVHSSVETGSGRV